MELARQPKSTAFVVIRRITHLFSFIHSRLLAGGGHRFRFVPMGRCAVGVFASRKCDRKRCAGLTGDATLPKELLSSSSPMPLGLGNRGRAGPAFTAGIAPIQRGLQVVQLFRRHRLLCNAIQFFGCQQFVVIPAYWRVLPRERRRNRRLEFCRGLFRFAGM